MKILLIADIHSNWPALHAIPETFDACLFLGDLVDYATDPKPCVDWVRQYALAGVRGNHDHAVAQRIPVRKRTGLSGLAWATRPLHWDVLTSEDLKFLGRLPVTRRVVLDGLRFYLVHATPRDPMDEYLKAEESIWRQRADGIETDFICVGHSHQPFCVELGDKRIINPGSVGQPRDGCSEAAYCIVENGVPSFRRVAYDIGATLDHMRRSGIADETIAMAEHFLRTGGRMPPAGGDETES